MIDIDMIHRHKMGLITARLQARRLYNKSRISQFAHIFRPRRHVLDSIVPGLRPRVALQLGGQSLEQSVIPHFSVTLSYNILF